MKSYKSKEMEMTVDCAAYQNRYMDEAVECLILSFVHLVNACIDDNSIDKFQIEYQKLLNNVVPKDLNENLNSLE